MNLPEINYLAVLIAAIGDMVVGGLWYSPLLFTKPWIKALGKTEKELAAGKQKGMAGLLVMSFISALVMAGALAYFLELATATTVSEAIEVGGLVWLGFFLAGNLPHYLYPDWSKTLIWIDLGYDLVKTLVMVTILVLMR